MEKVGKECFRDDDEEEQPRQSHANEEEEDVRGGFDGMNVEDWLAQHHEMMAERPTRSTPVHTGIMSIHVPTPSTTTPTASSHDDETLGHTRTIDHHCDAQDGEGEDDDDIMVNVEDWLVKHHEEASRSCTHHDVQAKRRRHDSAPPVIIRGKEGLVSRTRAIHHDHSSTTTPPDEDEDGNRNNSTDEGDVEILDASFHAVGYANTSRSDFYVAELSPGEDRRLVIEGVKTVNPRTRRICVAVGLILVACALAVGAGMITTIITDSSSSRRQSGANNVTMSANNNASATVSPAALDETHVAHGNLNWTIAESMIDAAGAGSIVSWFLSTVNGQIFVETLNRTDTSFTSFAIMSDAKPLDALIPLSVVTKVVTPLWYGHFVSEHCGLWQALLSSFSLQLGNLCSLLTLSHIFSRQCFIMQTDVIENYIVEGPSLAVEDLYDGMILMSMSGYPLVIQLDPLRVNNVSISVVYRNYFYKNGVAHYLLQYPIPVVPYLGKSSFDVLVRTNEMRGGDLSDFIALIESSADFKFQLQLREGDNKAITLFVPTNGALSTLDPSLLVGPDLQNLLLNHVVSGNFVRRRWWVIPTGTKVSDTELLLETQGGQVLNVTIHDDVTINGDVRIIEEDIFSEQGVIHVIDKPL
jgi:uncharacterized surface protein with fasciclin (FAS1) repeats